MTPITRTALYVFAGFAVLLGITSMLVDEPRLDPRVLGDDTEMAFRERFPGANQAHMAVLELSTYDRAEVLRNEILIAGFPCERRVLRTFHQGPDNSSSSVEFWNVACQDGHTYSIGIDSSGSTKVLSCGVLKAMGQVECFMKF